MNTAYRECEQRKNEHVDAGACAVALAGSSLLAKHQLLAKNGDFFGSVGICSKGFACRESCYVNRQVSTYS